MYHYLYLQRARRECGFQRARRENVNPGMTAQAINKHVYHCRRRRQTQLCDPFCAIGIRELTLVN